MNLVPLADLCYAEKLKASVYGENPAKLCIAIKGAAKR